MDQISKVPSVGVAALLAGRERDREILRVAAREAGSPAEMVRQKYPRVGASCPPALSEHGLVEHGTVAWYEDAEARLTLCERCPADGAVCADTTTLVKPGRKPAWDGERVVPVLCPRWNDYVVRSRLSISGVPERYQRATFAEFEETTDSLREAVSAVLAAHVAIVAGTFTWLVLSGPPKSGKSHLACALLRNVVRSRARARLWYADMLALRLALKTWQFDSEEGDPMDPLRKADVLVIDNVDAPRLKKDSEVRERIEDLLRERWTRQRSTILTTHQPFAALVEAFQTITTLSEARTCILA